MLRLLKYLLLSLLSLVMVGVIAVAGLYYYVKPELPSVDTLRDVRLQTPMQIYSADGKLIQQFGEQRRIPLTLDEIPQQMIDAILATEDSRFYEHRGIDPIGVMRAFMVLLRTGEIREGASTITMQLARNFFLTRERAWMRKIKESFIALHIEQLLSKDEILELYLNKLALGHRAFGVGAAAQVYYGRDIHQLSLAEVATIAGLPQGPSILNPISNPSASMARRRVVLRRMLTEGLIDREAFEAAFHAPVTASYHVAEVELQAPFVAEMVRRDMVAMLGEEEAYNGGYRVYTTIDSEQQAAARQALRDNLHAYDERHGYRGPERQLWGFEEDELSGFREADDELFFGQLPDEATMELILEYGSDPWPESAVARYLQQQPRFGMLEPAVVLEVAEQSATVMRRGGAIETIPWSGLDWAREFRANDEQGPAPQQATEILQPGYHIWVREQAGDYQLAQVPGPGSALVALDPEHGGIQALSGGYSFSMSQYNRATQAQRQVGSTIKPFIYAAALDEGDYTLASLVNDAPITQWNPGAGSAWRPRNSPEVYDGPIRLREALARSKNVVSVRLIRSVGVDRTADYLTRFGFAENTIPRNESLSLGSASFTPLAMARGFAVFANGGYLVEPWYINHIEDRDGRQVYTANPRYACADCQQETYREELLVQATAAADGEPVQLEPEAELPYFRQAPRVIPEQIAYLVTEALHSSIWGGGSWQHQTGWNGTAWRAQSLRNRNLAGKTGTTNDVRDTWFVGYSKGLVAATWVGFDSVDQSLGRVTLNRNLGRERQPIVGSEAGATTALPGWVQFMETALPKVDSSAFELPPDMVSVRIDQATGQLSNRSDHTSRFEYFIRGTEPTEYVREDNDRQRIFEEGGDSLFQ